MFFPFSFCFRKIRSFGFLTFICIATSHVAHANPTTLSVVETSDNGPRFSVTFDGSPRASQVIEQGLSLIQPEKTSELAHSSSFVYWPGAGLFEDSADNNTQRLLADIKRNLEQVENDWRSDDIATASISSFKAFLYTSVFKTRIPVTLDMDYYLAGGKENPLLQGPLVLQLPTRPNHVWLVGAVEKSQKAAFSSQKTASDYLNDIQTLNTFGISHVVVIQPNGELEEHPIAYWNAHPKNVAPGAIIFVPFQRLPSNLASLNGDISLLLQHRVL